MADAPLLEVKEPNLANLTIAAVSAFHTSMFESNETQELFEKEKDYYAAIEPLSTQTQDKINARSDAKATEKAELLNKSWQKLGGEQCGLQVVIYLLDFGSQTPILMDNAYQHLQILIEALTITGSRISGHFVALPLLYK